MRRMHIIYIILERKVCHLLKDCSMQISIDEFCQVVWELPRLFWAKNVVYSMGRFVFEMVK